MIQVRVTTFSRTTPADIFSRIVTTTPHPTTTTTRSSKPSMLRTQHRLAPRAFGAIRTFTSTPIAYTDAAPPAPPTPPAAPRKFTISRENVGGGAPGGDSRGGPPRGPPRNNNSFDGPRGPPRGPPRGDKARANFGPRPSKVRAPREVSAPSQSRFSSGPAAPRRGPREKEAAGGERKRRGPGGGKEERDYSYGGDHVKKEVLYQPEDVNVVAPATALTEAGLASALVKETEGVRKGCGKWGLAQWRGYDRVRAVRARSVVDGLYMLAAGGEEGTVAGEVRRLVAKNGTFGGSSKRRMLSELKTMVGALPAVRKAPVSQQIGA